VGEGEGGESDEGEGGGRGGGGGGGSLSDAHWRRGRRASVDDLDFPASSLLSSNNRRWKSMADFSVVPQGEEEEEGGKGGGNFLTAHHHFHSKSVVELRKINTPAYQRKGRTKGEHSKGRSKRWNHK
jgi:hypothetical protein